MGNIFCSNCGSKHTLGSKFCTNCGNALSGFSNINRPSIQQQNILVSNNRQKRNDVDEDGLPTSFVKPSRLAYEIEKPLGNKYSAKDLFHSSPVDPSERSVSSPSVGYRKMTKEELLAQSLKECSSRPTQDIDET